MKTPVLAMLFGSLLLSSSCSAYAQGTISAVDSSSIKSFSKLDFVPGEQIVGYEDFVLRPAGVKRIPAKGQAIGITSSQEATEDGRF